MLRGNEAVFLFSFQKQHNSLERKRCGENTTDLVIEVKDPERAQDSSVEKNGQQQVAARNSGRGKRAGVFKRRKQTEGDGSKERDGRGCDTNTARGHVRSRRPQQNESQLKRSKGGDGSLDAMRKLRTRVVNRHAPLSAI